MFWSQFIFRGHSTRELPSSRVTYLFCQPTQEPVLTTANTGKTQDRFGKKCRWMNRKGRNQLGRNPWRQALHVCLYTDLSQTLKGEPLSSVFPTDRTLFLCPQLPTVGHQVTMNSRRILHKRNGTLRIFMNTSHQNIQIPVKRRKYSRLKQTLLRFLTTQWNIRFNQYTRVCMPVGHSYAQTATNCRKRSMQQVSVCQGVRRRDITFLPPGIVRVRHRRQVKKAGSRKTAPRRNREIRHATDDSCITI